MGGRSVQDYTQCVCSSDAKEARVVFRKCMTVTPKTAKHGRILRLKKEAPRMKIVEKPWGREIWVAHNSYYALKIIELNAGSRSSLQYHNQKHEHLYIDQGRMRATLEQPDGTLQVFEYGPGTVIEVPPGRRHRVEAIEDLRLLEVSTPQLDDVVRVEDDHGR